jgi:hypothetical protein
VRGKDKCWKGGREENGREVKEYISTGRDRKRRDTWAKDAVPM